MITHLIDQQTYICFLFCFKSCHGHKIIHKFIIAYDQMSILGVFCVLEVPNSIWMTMPFKQWRVDNRSHAQARVCGRQLYFPVRASGQLIMIQPTKKPESRTFLGRRFSLTNYSFHHFLGFVLQKVLCYFLACFVHFKEILYSTYSETINFCHSGHRHKPNLAGGRCVEPLGNGLLEPQCFRGKFPAILRGDLLGCTRRLEGAAQLAQRILVPRFRAAVPRHEQDRGKCWSLVVVAIIYIFPWIHILNIYVFVNIRIYTSLYVHMHIYYIYIDIFLYIHIYTYVFLCVFILAILGISWVYRYTLFL